MSFLLLSFPFWIFCVSLLGYCYRKNITKPNSRANPETSIFPPLLWHIIGIRILGNSLGHIQMKITLLISIEKIKKLCSNSSTECVLPKTFRPRPKTTYCSKVVVETVTKGHISRHFLSDYGSRITSH